VQVDKIQIVLIEETSSWKL